MKFSKKIRGFIVALSLILMFSASLYGCDNNGSYTKAGVHTKEANYKYTYNLLGENEMPVQVFSGPISEFVYDGVKLKSLMTDEIFASLKECGVNTILGVENGVENDLTDIRTTLDLTEKHKINYVVFDPKIIGISVPQAYHIVNNKDESFLQRKAFYENYDSFAGMFLVDEPSILKNQQIIEAQNFMKENFDASKIAYVNMLPVTNNYQLYSGVKGDSSVTYEMLLDEFMKTVKPKYLSYDRYPFGDKGDVLPGWFDNLAKVRYYANKYNVPFWGHVQAGGKWENIPVRLPSENDFMWDINTMLAYGCKGLSYFLGVHSTYHIDNDFGNEGLISLDGKKTRWWHYAKTIDEQISAVENILMNSANLGIMVNGASPDAITNDFIDIHSSFRELKSVTGADSIVGCFDYNGKTTLYVVNNSVRNDGNVTLDFDKKYCYDVVQQGIFRSVTGKSLTLKLSAGEGALVTLR